GTAAGLAAAVRPREPAHVRDRPDAPPAAGGPLSGEPRDRLQGAVRHPRAQPRRHRPARARGHALRRGGAPRADPAQRDAAGEGPAGVASSSRRGAPPPGAVRGCCGTRGGRASVVFGARPGLPGRLTAPSAPCRRAGYGCRVMLVAGLETHQKVEIAVMAAVFIVFALVSSFVLPRRNSTFPGSGLRWYIVLCVALFVGMMTTIIYVAREPATAEASKENAAPPTKTVPTAPATGDPVAGKAVFASAGCGACHAFQAAGSTGTGGPDLDKLAEAAQTANRGSLAALTPASIVDPGASLPPGSPNGVMPPNFGPSLSKTQIDDLVAFLTQGH